MYKQSNVIIVSPSFQGTDEVTSKAIQYLNCVHFVSNIVLSVFTYFKLLNLIRIQWERMVIIHSLPQRIQVTESLSRFPKLTDAWSSDSQPGLLAVEVHSHLIRETFNREACNDDVAERKTRKKIFKKSTITFQVVLKLSSKMFFFEAFQNKHSNKPSKPKSVSCKDLTDHFFFKLKRIAAF